MAASAFDHVAIDVRERQREIDGREREVCRHALQAGSCEPSSRDPIQDIDASDVAFDEHIVLQAR